MPINVDDLNLPLRGSKGWDVPFKAAVVELVDLYNEQEAATEAAVGVISGAVDANDATVAAAASSSGTATRTYLDGRFGLKPTNGARAVGAGELVLNVDDYGATGNGTTDDTTAIQSALTAARAAKAVLTFTRNKTYIVSATLNPTGVNMQGFGATLKVKPSITMNFNLFQSSGAFTATDLTLDLNKANTTDPGSNTQGCGVYMFATSGWAGVAALTNVRVINGHQVGIRAQTASTPTDAATVPASALILVGCQVENTKFGTWLSYLSRLRVIGCVVDTTTADGMYDFVTRDARYIANTVTNAGGHGIVTQYSSGFIATGNRTRTTVGGITVGGGSTTITEARDFVIANNFITGSTLNGISIDTTKIGFGTTVVDTFGSVTGNVIRGNTIHGIYLHNAGHVSVSGNTCHGNLNGGLAMDARYVSVSGNTFTANAWGIKFLGNTGTYGNYAIGRNLVQLNTTAQFFFDTVGFTDLTLDLQGQGTPEGVVAAPVGSRFSRTDGGAGTCMYVKESGGVTSTGWVAK
jgi:parallel beta-helix repeat protein